MEEAEIHETRILLVQSVPDEVYAGQDVPLKVGVSCLPACDLRGSVVKVVDAEGPVLSKLELTKYDDIVNETDEAAVPAPTEPGKYSWTVAFPAQEAEGLPHGESSVLVSFTVKEHATSIAVWDVPAPAVAGARFRIKVGAKCRVACALGGQKVDVLDETGALLASGVLGDEPWHGTTGLFWSDVQLQAPDEPGDYRWQIRFAEPALELPHGEAAFQFAFRTAPPPEHTITVRATDKQTGKPLAQIRVVAKTYRTQTNEDGLATLAVPGGQYELIAYGEEYGRVKQTIEVTDDVALDVELGFRPPNLG